MYTIFSLQILSYKNTQFVQTTIAIKTYIIED